MAKIEITTSDGKTFPCRMTMGALVRFKRETGRDVSEMDGSVSDMSALIWCATKSACNADGIPFDYSLEEFADRIDSNDMSSFASRMQEDTPESGKKKARA